MKTRIDLSRPSKQSLFEAWRAIEQEFKPNGLFSFIYDARASQSDFTIRIRALKPVPNCGDGAEKQPDIQATFHPDLSCDLNLNGRRMRSDTWSDAVAFMLVPLLRHVNAWEKHYRDEHTKLHGLLHNIYPKATLRSIRSSLPPPPVPPGGQKLRSN